MVSDELHCLKMERNLLQLRMRFVCLSGHETQHGQMQRVGGCKRVLFRGQGREEARVREE